MSSDGIAISVRGVSKHYLMFDRPQDRMKQMVVPGLQRLFGREPRCYYRDFAALHDVSFEVRRGEAVGIIGRNGSGKSTLLQIICGILQPSAGEVRVGGRIAALLELGAGFNPDFTGRENVYLNAAILGIARAEVDARFDDIARFADIGHFIDQPVKTYSSGMYVRLAFATAVNVDPDILVVDEALAVGDEAFQRKCFARIEQMRARGATILFVSHSAQTVIQLCDRALWVERGQLLMDAAPKTVVDAYHRTLAEQRADDSPRPDAEPGSGAVLALSEAVIEYPSVGGRIIAASLTTEEGQPVAQLEHEHRYRFSYRLRADQDLRGLRLGMLVKTRTGVEVAGAVLALADQGCEQVQAGTTVLVDFTFACLMYPGRYFINCGVTAEVDGEEQYVHRLVDAFEIVVINPSRRNRAGVSPEGLVDLGFAATAHQLGDAGREGL